MEGRLCEGQDLGIGDCRLNKDYGANLDMGGLAPGIYLTWESTIASVQTIHMDQLIALTMSIVCQISMHCKEIPPMTGRGICKYVNNVYSIPDDCPVCF